MALKLMDGFGDFGIKFINLFNTLTATVNNLAAGTPAGTYTAGDGVGINGSSEISADFASDAQTVTGTSSVLVAHPSGVAAAIADVVDAGPQVRVSAYRLTDHSITANTRTKVVWNGEEWDIGSDMGVSDFTAPSDGYYVVSTAVLVSGNAADDTVTYEIEVNGVVKANHSYQARGGAWTTSAITKTVWANAGELINTYIKNDTTACTVKAALYRSYFQVTKSGE